MNRQYVRVALGGIHDEAEIRGHRRTYIGAMTGRIADAVIKSGVMNPIILLDEIDKVGNDYKGDPSSALLEALDPEQNNSFCDHYLDFPLDLSKVLFITTANDTSTISAPLYDRMEVIELNSYTVEEKFNIAKKHLLRKEMQKHSLTAREFKLSDDAIYKIIESYTREAGVRNLEKHIATLCRKATVELESGKKSVRITAKNITDYLGAEKYTKDEVAKDNQVGVVNGLAWTQVGGTLLPIEISVVDGTGKIELTGNLGDVMKESARTAVSYIRSKADEYGLDKEFYKNKDIHIHAPEGAIPKDGPSAGLAITTALLSELSGIEIKHNVAMTGEISLKGKALAIGGLNEKSMAAYKAGCDTVIIPKDEWRCNDCSGHLSALLGRQQEERGFPVRERMNERDLFRDQVQFHTGLCDLRKVFGTVDDEQVAAGCEHLLAAGEELIDASVHRKSCFEQFPAVAVRRSDRTFLFFSVRRIHEDRVVTVTGDLFTRDLPKVGVKAAHT